MILLTKESTNAEVNQVIETEESSAERQKRGCYEQMLRDSSLSLTR